MKEIPFLRQAGISFVVHGRHNGHADPMAKLAIIVGLALTMAGCDAPNVGYAMEAVRNEMRDPEATQFRDVRTCPGKASVVVGEFNGKNGLGGYTGFRKFVYSHGEVRLQTADRLAEFDEGC